MADAILNRFVAAGTAAERAAFTPDPPSPAVGPDHGYYWFETDTEALYAWNPEGSPANWVLVASAGGLGDVVGPASATDEAFARFSGTTGKLIQNSTGATLDDAGRAVFKSILIPLYDAGNSGTSKTLDWENGNEQLLTLTGNVTLDLDNPEDGGRYVIVLATGAGGFTVTWPGEVLWPAGTPPTITVGASAYDLVTLICIESASPRVYLASINQNYS